MQDLEDNRLFLLNRLGILRLLSIIEALVIGFLAFVFIKDLIIAVILACIVGILFFRFTSKKLILAKNELELNITRLFLRQNKAKLKLSSINEKDFLKLNFLQNLSEFKSVNSFEFDDFKLYDLLFKDEFKRAFCGVLVCFNKELKQDANADISDIFIRVKDRNFNTNVFFKKGNSVLIPSLKNPFFANLNLTVKTNLELMQENLKKIRNINP